MNFIPRPYEGRQSYRRNLQPFKENTQHFKNWNFLTFFYFCWSFLPSSIRIRIQPTKSMRIRIHVNSDPQHYLYVTLWIEYNFLVCTYYLRQKRTFSWLDFWKYDIFFLWYSGTHTDKKNHCIMYMLNSSQLLFFLQCSGRRNPGRVNECGQTACN
jgi:hypothetical protein